MTVTPLEPDTPLSSPEDVSRVEGGASSFGAFVTRAFGDASEALRRADAAEHAFARGRGGLQEMALERAQADVALSVATTTVSRAAQAVSTIFGMQV